MRRTVAILISILWLLIASSCDYEYVATYRITNGTTSTLYVYKENATVFQTDTILVNATKDMHITTGLSTRVIDDAPNSINEGKLFYKVLRDTIPYKSNPREISRWSKEEPYKR